MKLLMLGIVLDYSEIQASSFVIWIKVLKQENTVVVEKNT